MTLGTTFLSNMFQDATGNRFFTPWGGEVAGTTGIHAIGAAIDVAP
jgi:hypothetical protein